MKRIKRIIKTVLSPFQNVLELYTINRTLRAAKKSPDKKGESAKKLNIINI